MDNLPIGVKEIRTHAAIGVLNLKTVDLGNFLELLKGLFECGLHGVADVDAKLGLAVHLDGVKHRKSKVAHRSAAAVDAEHLAGHIK